MKRTFKIIGIVLAGILGLLVVATVIAAISGAFSQKKINIEQLSWATDKVRVVDDFKATINFLPENANQLDVELKFVYTDGADIIELPEKVKAGEEFTIKVKKDANNVNVGGEVVIQAKTNLVVTQTNLKILVDVPIPNNGLLIASDFDSTNEETIINAGSSNFGLYVFTNPNLAINPNTGKEIDLIENYKDVTLKSADTTALQILSGRQEKEGFYCPDYIEHGHKGPFKDSSGQALSQICSGGKKLEKHKYLEFSARATTSSQAPVIVTAKALRTYSMQEGYVDKSTYVDADGRFEGEIRQKFYEDLSNYVNEFKDYIINDTRVNYDSQNPATINYNSGSDFIEDITTTNSNGEEYIKIEGNSRIHEEAAYFYLFVECRALFNIEEIEIDSIKSNLLEGSKYSYKLHDDVQQYTIDDLINEFKIELIPSNTEDFTSEDLKYRIRELKIMSIMNKIDGSSSEYNFDYCGYVFDIENPTNLNNPVWKIRSINPVAPADRNRNVRLRFYVPSKESGDFSPTDPYVDIGVDVLENQVQEFVLKTTGNDALATKMILNSSNINGLSYRQMLDSSRYNLSGADGTAPTYNTVKFFVTKESAKTKDNGAETSYFKVKLNPSSATTAPALKTMVYGGTVVEAYEIAYEVAGMPYLEALNVTNGDNLTVFAAVVKTDHNGLPIDSEGVSMGSEGYNGNYVIIAKTANDIEISIDNYLESLNIYSIDDKDTPTYHLRNVPETGESQTTDTIQLLADQNYVLKASPYYLTDSGKFYDNHPAYANKEIDYKTNLLWATDHAYGVNKLIEFNSASSDIVVPLVHYDNANAIFTINVSAEIDKNASYGHVTEAFDFKANGVGDLQNVFKSNRSTVNMIVNYAKIDLFNLATTTDESGAKDYYVLSPKIEAIGGEQGAVIKWRDQAATTTDFELLHNYVLDIQKTTTNESGEIVYNSKIDKTFATEEYVASYINLITNPLNTDAIKLDWVLEFDRVDGYTDADDNIIWGRVPHGANVEDYLSIEEETYADDNGITRSKPVLNIKKGTAEGVFIKATCSLSIYKTNSGYIDYKQAVVNLVLKQSQVKYELYSPKKINNADALIINQPGENDAFIVKGGGNDGRKVLNGTEEIILEGYDLLKNYGIKDSTELNVYERSGEAADSYTQVKNPDNTNKTAYRLVNSILGDDGELAGFCTYTINNSDTGAPIYFKDTNGNKVYTTVPTKKGEGFELVLYVEHIADAKNATITIASPFGDTFATYNIYVLSSIVLSAPSQNIATSTTMNNSGEIDLKEKFTAVKEGTNLKTSFEITDGSLYASVSGTEKITLANGVEETLKTTLTPHNVYSNQPVGLKMFYYLPQTTNGVTTYTKTEIIQIGGRPLAIIVSPGYSIVVNQNIQNEELEEFVIKSGESKNFFNDYATNPDAFIKIINLTTNQPVTENVRNMLGNLISLGFDEDKIKLEDKAIFESLFAGNDKAQIEKGQLLTQSISNTITIPISINFKEGSINDEGGSDSYTPTQIATFYCKVEASVEFYIQTINAEGNTYKADNIMVNGNPVTDSKIGHEYKNSNVDVDSNGYINTGNYLVNLFDVNKTNNILSLKGSDDVELFGSKFLSYNLYKFNAASLNYRLSASDYNVGINLTTDEFGVDKLNLNIINSVNETTYYRLSIKTSINKDNETFDYYFTLIPKYKLTRNYPMVEGPEKVKPLDEVDLSKNYINNLNRIEVFSTELIGDVETNVVYKIDLVDGNRYSLTSETYPQFNKSFLLSDNEKSITLSIIEGSAASIIDNKIVFGVPTNINETIIVRATLFNGAFIDYTFDLFKSLPSPELSVKKDVVLYAGKENSVNLLDETEKYISVPSFVDGFKYIIKYDSYSEVPARVLDSTSLNPLEELKDPNKIITYYGNKLIVQFDDVSKDTTVSFSVWHNYFTNGMVGLKLNIKLLPNLQISENKIPGTNTNTVQQLVAGVETDIITTGNNSWLRIDNKSLDGISCELKKIDGNESFVEEDITVSGTNNTAYKYTQGNFEIIITFDEASKKWIFESNNIGVARNLVFLITKDADGLKYSYEFEISLVPNIDLHSAYTTNAFYAINGASVSDGLSGRAVLLNNEPNVYNPTDFAGNQLVLEVKEGNGTVTTQGVSFNVTSCTSTGDSIEGTGVRPVPGIIGHSGGVSLTLTIDSVNETKLVYFKIKATWTNGAEAYERILRIQINPNIITTGTDVDRVIYTSGNSLNVFAGSTIELDFSNSLFLSQNNNSARVFAKQVNASLNNVDANILLKAENSTYYDVYKDSISGKAYIMFKGVPSAKTIELPIYYNLKSKIVQVSDQNRAEEVKGVKTHATGKYTDDEIDFNNADLVYNPNKTIRITIQPSIAAITYQEGKKHDTEETAIDITKQFVNNVYTAEGIGKSSEEFSSDSHIQEMSDGQLKANSYNMIDNLFNFSPVSNVTFDNNTASSNVYVNKEMLYSSFEYAVTGRKGNVGTQSWGNIERPEQYYVINKNEGIISLIPPTKTGNDNIIELRVEVKLPGMIGEFASQVVYFTLQFADGYKNIVEKEDGTVEETIVSIGTGGYIIDSYNFTNGGIKLNDKGTDGKYIESIDLNKKFYFGYLLRQKELGNEASDVETLTTTNNVLIVTRSSNNKKYYYYLLSDARHIESRIPESIATRNSIPLSFSFADQNSAMYASINSETGHIIPEVYYKQGSNQEIRSVKIQVTAGIVSQSFTVQIQPRDVEHTFEYNTSDNTFNNNLISNEEPVDVMKNEVELIKEGLTDADYERYNSWLTYNEKTKKYSFNPDLNWLSEDITLQFENTITVNESQNQIFIKTLEVQLKCAVGLIYNKNNGVITNSTGSATKFKVLGKEGIDALFTSNIFDGANITGRTVTLKEASENVKYGDYVNFSNDVLVSENSPKTYTISNNSEINILAKEILVNVVLPYTITLNFTINGNEYVLTKNFNLIIKANAGLTNLKELYQVKPDTTNHTANLTTDILGNDLEVIGAGNLKFEVTELSIQGTNQYSYTAINAGIITFTPTITSENSKRYLKNIAINYSELMAPTAPPEGHNVASVYHIKVNVYYVINSKETKIKNVLVQFIYQ